MQDAQEMTVLTPAQVEQVSGGKLFGFIVGFGLAVGAGAYGAAASAGMAVSEFEDWVNGD